MRKFGPRASLAHAQVWPTRGRGRPARQRFDARQRLRSASTWVGRAALAYYLAGSATRTAPQRQRTLGKLFLQGLEAIDPHKRFQQADFAGPSYG